MFTKPILSICIPTYNRAYYLEKTLQSIVKQPIFTETNAIEIVISDNCSTDTTPTVVESFIQKYGTKISYFRNTTNMMDMNFELALSRGTGDFLKLHNDTLCILPNSLEAIVSFIKEALPHKPILFFLDGNAKDTKEAITYMNTADELIAHVSFYCTWIGGFGIWKKDFISLHNFSRKSKQQLTQVDVLLRLLQYKQHSAVYNPRIVSVQRIPNKGGYNIAEIFSKNYNTILQEACADGIISEKIYLKEKKNILLKHVNYYYFDIKEEYNFIQEKYWEYTAMYHKNLYFYVDLVRFFLRKISKNFSRCVLEKSKRNKRHWRKLNKHNSIHLVNYKTVPTKYMKRIIVGKYSYGNINPIFFGSANESVTIGNYVSIASGVEFLCGGGHAYQGFSTYPFNALLLHKGIEVISKGPIIIEDDVWIGSQALILSGVVVGQGAIIGARAVVTKNVEPYSIVVGNPARCIKYRFSKEIRELLLSRADFSTLTKEKIEENTDILYSVLEEDTAQAIIEKLF